jgi:hypothetical protein
VCRRSARQGRQPCRPAAPPLTRRPAPRVLPVGIARGKLYCRGFPIGMATIRCRYST